ncbi:MAG: hypothetical protein HKN74_01895 [Acidimicrobiia bacterium]|nr:hypothetical protein [Acidimicrobiia bacterium]MBT8216662.1 hypothetical protein [Acidimicrobiia bacterium]NNF09014.1 hypothetical protein [Acidimicrobiia bacterium]NNL69015.1 hypothetical protein [Acidimicrobiia bacterium]
MLYMLLAAYHGTRRALAKDQRRPDPAEVGFWQLVVGEFPILARRVGALKIGTIILVFFGAVIAAEIVLNEATPGPFLTPRWRVAVGLAATVVFVLVWAIVHAIRSVGFQPPKRPSR